MLGEFHPIHYQRFSYAEPHPNTSYKFLMNIIAIQSSVLGRWFEDQAKALLSQVPIFTPADMDDLGHALALIGSAGSFVAHIEGYRGDALRDLLEHALQALLTRRGGYAADPVV